MIKKLAMCASRVSKRCKIFFIIYKRDKQILYSNFSTICKQTSYKSERYSQIVV